MVQPTSNRILTESKKGVANGLATLDPGGKIPDGQLNRAAANGLATLGADGKLPDAQAPTAGGVGAWWTSVLTSLKALFPQKDQAVLNILDYGVTRGTTASQTAAIKAALDANPGASFYFPPGDYRLDTGLVIGKSNSLVLSEGTRLYAGAPMTTMITYAKDTSGYSEDKSITGYGWLLDGALNAQRIMSLSKVIRFSLIGGNFRDGINRGLVTEAGLGAELFAEDLRFYNSGTTNVADNVAIEANMGDSHYRNVIIRDWTTAVKDTSANRWNRVHPWISQDVTGNTQMTSRYPTSIGFDITGSSDVTECVTDTYRTAYKIRSNGTSYTAPPRFLNSRAMWANDPILTTALATANPAYVIDNTDGVGLISDRMTMTGHSTAPGNLLTGPATNLDMSRTKSYGYIKGAQGTTNDPLEYAGGIQQGTFLFTPTIYGSGGNGTHAYTTQSGRMVVDKDVTTYFIRVKATLDATSAFQGVARIGGLPIPPGATNVRDGAGSVGYAQNIPAAGAVIFANTAPYVSLMKLDPLVGMSEIDIAGSSLRTKVIDLILTVRVTHYKA